MNKDLINHIVPFYGIWPLRRDMGFIGCLLVVDFSDDALNMVVGENPSLRL